MSKYYLAYGSNLNLEQMRERCAGAKVVGTAMVKDYRLLFKGSRTGSFLTIEKKKGAKVPVGVWEISPENEAELDRYEGCPFFYYKKEMNVVLEETGEKVRALVYIMHEDRKLGIPSQRYINTCLAGYKAFGFDEMFLYEALKNSTEDFDESYI